MPLGQETQKSHQRRIDNGDYDKYFKGKGIDIGYRGYRPNVVPVAGSIGVELGDDNYDGLRLVFPDNTIDFVHSSHCLEHIDDYKATLQEWFRVLKTGGYLIITVPHKFLYEKRRQKPSRWNRDHRRFYTPASLLAEIEESLPPNSYRIKRLFDNDEGYDYSIPPSQHANGCYEIELIIQKIQEPKWNLD